MKISYPTIAAAAAAAAAAVAAYILMRYRDVDHVAQALPHVILVDNGSLRADSFMSLRSLAHRVSEATGVRVHAASARFADRVVLPDGTKGASLESLSRTLLAADGGARFLVLPAFFGPSDTLAEFVPAVYARLTQEYPKLGFTVARAAVDVRDRSDTRIARALLENAAAAAAGAGFAPGSAALAVCDHGSPVPAVGLVRGHIEGQVRALLSGSSSVYRAVSPCSMERRPGESYDFNDPLLEVLLRTPPFNAGDVVLAMLFISPGKHAGAGGDIDAIIASATAEAAAQGRVLRVAKSPLLGDAQALTDVIADRLREALTSRP
jgi:hypothetical protein